MPEDVQEALHEDNFIVDGEFQHARYWSKRAELMGERGVYHVLITDERAEEEDRHLLQVFEPLKPCGNMLELGCGAGRMYRLLHDRCKQYIGVDFSQDMLNVAKTQLDRPQDKLILKDITTRLPFQDNSFDVVFFCVVLQHIVDQYKFAFALKEAKRVLKVGGKIYIYEAMTEGFTPIHSEHFRTRMAEHFYYVLAPEIQPKPVDFYAPFGGLHGFFEGIKKTPLIMKPRLDIGCGTHKVWGMIGIDSRKGVRHGVRIVDIIADMKALPIRGGVIEEIMADDVIEHDDNPYIPLFEINRVIKKDSKVTIILPYPGTASSDGDPTHKIVWDAYRWTDVFTGFFRKINVIPVGHRYRSVGNKWKRAQERVLKNDFHDMAQGGRFVCRLPIIPQTLCVPQPMSSLGFIMRGVFLIPSKKP